MYSLDRNTIEAALPQIRQLRSVESAWYADEGIEFVTRAWRLRHRISMLPFARIKVRLSKSGIGLSYLLPFSNWFHWHPTIDKKIGDNFFRYACLGQYPSEMKDVWREQGPLYAVLLTLAMLQGIRAQDKEDMFLLDWGHVYFFVSISLLVASLTLAALDSFNQ